MISDFLLEMATRKFFVSLQSTGLTVFVFRVKPSSKQVNGNL
jgi:hypothetical protein